MKKQHNGKSIASSAGASKSGSEPQGKTALWLGAFVMVAGLCMIGVVYMTQHPPAAVETVQANQQVKNYTPEQQETIAFVDDYEDVLNRFLTNVQASVRDYKHQRQILDEMTDPFNMRDPDYATENYAAIKTLAPGLREKMDAVFTVFLKTEQDLQKLLEGRPESTQKTVQARWQALKDKQMALYVDYFTYEEKILRAYEELLAFYAENQNQIMVDSDFIAVDFSDETLKQQEQSYLDSIKTMKERQMNQLKQASIQ